MTRLHYLSVLDLAHQTLYPRRYLEIGVSKGDSAALVLDSTDAVGVDPSPRVNARVPGHFRLERRTSDEYFARLDRHPTEPFDLMFIDGLHLFEFALRDFLNCERHAHPGSVVTIHDCVPTSEVMARREPSGGLWTGDVWKLLAYLLDERADLRVEVVDAPPTGLVVVTGFRPEAAPEEWADIAVRYAALGYEDFEGRILSQVELAPSTDETVRRVLPHEPFRSTSGLEDDLARRARRGRDGLSPWSQARSLVGSERGRALLMSKLLRR